MELGLKGRVAIVAASSQGLGLAIAQSFATEGCKIAMCARGGERLHAAAQQIATIHAVEVFERAVDVTNRQAVAQFVADTAEKFGRIDICVASSGGPPAKDFMATTPEEWEQAVAGNLFSVIYFAQAVLPHMQRNRWGRIIAITSITTKQPEPKLVLSNAVRAGVVGLVRSLANEFGKDGILVNNVGPGYTATDRLKNLAKMRAANSGEAEDEIWRGWSAASPLNRVGEPRELADTVLFLASERASFITGQTILVDGGAYKGL
jgi:3-oxoacyl-[acyl-carrier protein] reductase